jgi:tetratricopeptide (TPR) repeat protein
MRSVILLLALFGLFLGSARLLHWNEVSAPARNRFRNEMLYYPSAAFLKRASLGHTSTAADLAWLRAVQYYGEHKRSDRRFELMGHISEIITDLEPQFVNAYVFGGLVTAQDAGRVERGIALMEKGVQNNPNSWRLAFETGFLYYVCASDYASAAGHFRRAVNLPGAPEKAMRFAAFAAQKAGDPRASLFLWRQFALQTQNAEMRLKAEEAIRRLEALVQDVGS